MRRIATTLVFVIGVISLGSVGKAQELTTAASTYASFGFDDLDGTLPLSAELRFTMPVSEKFALEPFVTLGESGGRHRSGLEGFYGLQVRQRIGFVANGFMFATYGVAGYYSKYGYDGPVIGHFGFGLKERLSEHLVFRPEVHFVTVGVIPVGARFVAGFSIDRGR